MPFLTSAVPAIEAGHTKGLWTNRKSPAVRCGGLGLGEQLSHQPGLLCPSLVSSSKRFLIIPRRRRLLQSPVELHLHFLAWTGPAEDVANHVGARGKVVLENGFAGSAHISQHRLSEMPPQQLVGYGSGVIGLTADLVELSTTNGEVVASKVDDGVIGLRSSQSQHPHLSATYIRIHGNEERVELLVYTAT